MNVIFFKLSRSKNFGATGSFDQSFLPKKSRCQEFVEGNGFKTNLCRDNHSGQV